MACCSCYLCLEGEEAVMVSSYVMDGVYGACMAKVRSLGVIDL